MLWHRNVHALLVRDEMLTCETVCISLARFDLHTHQVHPLLVCNLRGFLINLQDIIIFFPVVFGRGSTYRVVELGQLYFPLRRLPLYKACSRAGALQSAIQF